MDPLRHNTSSQSVKDTSFEVEDVYEDDELTLQQSNSFAQADVFPLQEQRPTVSLSSRDDTKVAVDQKAPHRSSSPTHRLRLSLNERQLRAVTFPLQSQLQILAGPGTGKTKTLISRVIFLLSQGVHPSNIIVTTFTVKAANEMRERIAAMVGPSVASRLVLGTFHSIAHETDALHFIQSVMKEVDPESDKNDCRHARNAISNMKSRAIQPSSLSALEYTTQEMMQVYSLYQDKLAEANFLDFDDLLLKCMELLRTNPLVVSNIQAVLVDEFQDTNIVQYQLMKLFAARRSNITIVGDPDQSIYAFRAAESTNLMRMRQDFQDTSVVSLEENYRSSGHILNAALAVIQQDTERIQKTVLPNHDEGHLPVFFPARNPYIEARHIVKEIQRLIDLSCGMLKPHDFAILVRSARLTRPIESELTKAGIDYRIVGGFRFWEREEIKLLVNYLVVVKSRRSPALLDIINSPRRGIGSVMQAALLNHANAYQVPIWDAIQRAIDGQVRVNAKVRASLKQFVDIITEAEKLVQDSSRETPLADALDYLITALDYKEVLQKDRGDTWAARWENVTDLKEHIRYFCATAPDPELPDIEGVEGNKAADDVLSRFLATVNLAPSEAESSAFDPTMVLTISTIHGSKGLEWPVVFIPGVYEGSIPHALSLANEIDLAEERRLLYVAMTRAKGMLYLSYPAMLTGSAMYSASKADWEPTCVESSFVSTIKHKFQNLLPNVTHGSMVTLGEILDREPPSLMDFTEAKKACVPTPASPDEYWASLAAEKGPYDNYDAADAQVSRYRYIYDEYDCDVVSGQYDESGRYEYNNSGSGPYRSRSRTASGGSSHSSTFQSHKRQRTVSGGSVTTLAAITAQGGYSGSRRGNDVDGQFAASFISGRDAMQTMAFEISSKADIAVRHVGTSAGGLRTSAKVSVKEDLRLRKTTFETAKSGLFSRSAESSTWSSASTSFSQSSNFTSASTFKCAKDTRAMKSTATSKVSSTKLQSKQKELLNGQQTLAAFMSKARPSTTARGSSKVKQSNGMGAKIPLADAIANTSGIVTNVGGPRVVTLSSSP